MPAEMGMPGRGMMFVGDQGVQISAFYGGSPWLPDHTLPRPGQQFRGLPGGQLLPESRFKDFKQPEPHLPRCERPNHYAEWVRACKADKKSITPAELACGLTEFALLGSATLRRYSTPGARGTTGWGRNGRSDSADAPRYWRSSKVLLWDSKAIRFTNDEVADALVDTPYRKEWDYKVQAAPGGVPAVLPDLTVMRVSAGERPVATGEGLRPSTATSKVPERHQFRTTQRPRYPARRSRDPGVQET